MFVTSTARESTSAHLPTSLVMDWEKKMRPVFDNIDLDKSGTITQAEYATFLKKSGMQYDAANVNADMDPMDADKDGKITFKEFVNFYKADYEKHHK
ncbi:uncharacterized protein LOC133347409 [Lethenteron reissneri]|uniref:uncharacterized protein LOC133347409 n=1 Tax=Lethenteron reissneri TaxID=7753 RepID=UPI002AB61716|nr:uncharacterized protein LOC133347409 [Lethenteron reissneri]